jgi:RNA polymerase sigma factor (sigma-70 family)
LNVSAQFALVSLPSAFRDSTMSSRALPSHVLQEGFPFLFLKGTQQIAEDAVQDALLSAYKNLGRFRGQAKLSTCLTTIVINAARMQLRRRSGYLSLDQEHGQDGLLFSEQLPNSRPSPEEVCSAVETRDRLVEGVQQLSPKLRRAFHFSCAISTAAHVLGVPQGTVKAQLARARVQLCGIMRVKHVRRRSRTVLRRKEVSTTGRLENWLGDDASGKFGTSSLPEEAK